MYYINDNIASLEVTVTYLFHQGFKATVKQQSTVFYQSTPPSITSEQSPETKCTCSKII